jgi:cytochrome P450
MGSATLLRRITDYANRADPYPLYAELRRTPVARQDDGVYAVSTYHEIHALLHDPRISSDVRNRPREAGSAPPTEAAGLPPTFIGLDPPEHDRLRRMVMRRFGPPHTPDRIDGMGDQLARITAELIDGFADRREIDIVDDFAYPFPVTVICSLLGVPREDEHRFRAWADAVVASIDPREKLEDRLHRRQQATLEMGQYMAELIERHRRDPGDDMLSGLATDDSPDGRLSPSELITHSILLFIAGHETTVNLITNGMLTLLRHPDALDLLRREPGRMPGAVEELLRYEPPIQMLPQRTALADVEVAGTAIPQGSPITLLLAAGNRDPARFADPDRFDPSRRDNQHLGFGSGVHTCFGAPLARLEAQHALRELIRRLDNPRLATDPPPYRDNPVLRGPRHLLVACDGVRP